MERTKTVVQISLGGFQRSMVVKLFTVMFFAVVFQFQSYGQTNNTGTASLYGVNPLPAFKTKTDALNVTQAEMQKIANSFPQGQAIDKASYQGVQTKAMILGHIFEISQQSHVTIAEAVKSAFFNGIDWGTTPYDQQQDAFIYRQWPQDYTDVVNLLKL